VSGSPHAPEEPSTVPQARLPDPSTPASDILEEILMNARKTVISAYADNEHLIERII
jgi:hypothetical protein